jgi:hypothetical protein
VRQRLLATALLAIVPAAARSQTVEITPIIGYRMGGNFLATIGTDPPELVDADVEEALAFGAHLGVRVSEDGELELLYSRQPTRLVTSSFFTGVQLFDIAVESWQAGGNYLFGEEGSRVRPYIGMGLGITRLLPEPADLHDETRFCASFAAGAKVWLGRHVGLRVEARGLFTVLEGDRDTFCQTGEGCRVQSSGSEISQAEVHAGLVLRF